MSIMEKMEEAIITAMKRGEKARLETLRLLKAALKNERIAKGADLTEDDVIAVIRRQIKQLKESVEEFVRGAREDLKVKAEAELAVLSEYIPRELEDGEIIAVIREKMADAGGAADIGKLMGVVMRELKGKAGGDRIRALAERILKGGT